MTRKYLVTVSLLVATAVLGCVMAWLRSVPEPVRQIENISTALPTEETTEMPTPSTEPPTTEPVTEPPATEPPPPPEECLIEDVPFYTQHGLLPTGCELVSAKMVLEYYLKEEIPIDDIVDKMKCQYPQDVNGKATAPHPEDAFIGSPYDLTSFGCFSPALVTMMNQFLPIGSNAVDTSGTSLQTLAETYLPQGTPVLIWATINMTNHHDYLGWYIQDKDGNPTDEWYDWQINEHCLVLIGYDSDYYYFNDPNAWQSQTRFGREIVEERFASMGMYSAVVENVQNQQPVSP